MGVLVFAPFLLSLLRLRREDEAATRTSLVEGGALLILVGVATELLFRSHLPIQYLVFPLLARIAWRFGQRGAGLGVLVTTGVAIWATIREVGPFADAGLLEKMVTLQVFNASAALSSFFLAAVVAERRRYLKERDRAEQELIRRALHDPLTGLANRSYFMERLSRAIARSTRRRALLGLAFLDLDRFKYINDTLGHEAGDQVLRQMAQRVEGLVREVDTASRFGGDEFLILFEDLRSADEATAIAERLLREIAKPLTLETGEIVVTTSIGLALAQGPEHDPEAMIRAADVALYRAKKAGRSRYVLYDESMRGSTTPARTHET
jgi:diguanylate cyclase (GGDEF)-like protein